MTITTVHRPLRKRPAGDRPRSAAKPTKPLKLFDPNDQSKWQFVETGGGWLWNTHDLMDQNQVWVCRERHIVCMHPELWRTLQYDERSMTRFKIDVTGGAMADGMSFVVVDAGPYAVAAKKRAAAEGTDVVMAKDALTQLTEAAESLIIQACGLNNGATVGQLEIFASRYHLITSQLEELEARMAKLRSTVGLAGTALMDI